MKKLFGTLALLIALCVAVMVLPAPAIAAVGLDAPALSSGDPIFVDDLVTVDGKVLADRRAVSDPAALDASKNPMMTATPANYPPRWQRVSLGLLLAAAFIGVVIIAFRDARRLGVRQTRHDAYHYDA